jgi:hypothetical protein
METIIKFLKSNGVLIAVAIVLIVFLGRECNVTGNLKGELRQSEEQVNLLKENNQQLRSNVDVWSDSTDFYRAKWLISDSLVAQKDIEMNHVVRIKDLEIKKLSTLTPVQADSALDMRYTHVPSREKSKAILTDLIECEKTALLLAKNQEKVLLLERKGLEMEQVIVSQEHIITSLEEIIVNLNEIIIEKDKQILSHKKAMRQLKWQRNGAFIGIGVVAALVIINK